MKDNKIIAKKNVIILILFVLLFVLLLASGALLPWVSYQVIENGFDAPLCTMLRDEYSVTVPSDAEFIKGKHTGFNDTYATLFWKIPANGKKAGEVIDSILDGEIWSSETDGKLDENGESYTGMTMEHFRESRGKVYSSLYYTDVTDGFVYVLFCGWRPSMKDVDTKIKINW